MRMPAQRPNAQAPNHALQPTGAHVTSRAHSAAAFPPAAHGPRHVRPWLSLGSLGVARVF